MKYSNKKKGEMIEVIHSFIDLNTANQNTCVLNEIFNTNINNNKNNIITSQISKIEEKYNEKRDSRNQS